MIISIRRTAQTQFTRALGARRAFSSKNEKTNPVRGMKDRFGEENRRFQQIAETGAKLASLYGFEHITTPILEYAQVFERTLGDDSDVVGKELYSFEDKGGSRLTMRPENTASVVRALISHQRYNELPQKYYYYGPMFRHERPQKGRLRQFEQFGVEMYGLKHPTADVEIIDLAATFLKNIGLDSVTLEINSLGDEASRQKYKEALRSYLKHHVEKLSADSVNRLSTNPLRILDSKSPQDQALLQQGPILSDYLSDDARARFRFITESLSHLDLPFHINQKLVRGLDYYQDTVFEFTLPNSPLLGAQQATVLAGGRYDGLVQKMGGPADIASIGWAAGIERLALLVEANEQQHPAHRVRPVALIPVPDIPSVTRGGLILASSVTTTNGNDNNNPSHNETNATTTTTNERVGSGQVLCTATAIARQLRAAGLVTELVHLTHATSNKSQLPKQLARAAKMGASHAILVGSGELAKGVVTLKDLDRAEQKECTLEQAIGIISSAQKGTFGN
ncbi:hypothetical protein DFQ26_005185 [Actinomortierella ambigua]|nr:hypothetical protein DFQ26_005185 [Actinomortierella ambigua]